MLKRNLSAVLLSLCFIICSCGKSEPEIISINKTEQEKLLHKSSNDLHNALVYRKQQEDKAITNYINSMSLQEKICQMFIVNIDGNRKFAPVEKMSLICAEDDSYIVPGGYLFFGFNLADTPEEVISFTDSIDTYCINNNITPPFLSIDQEGGKVNRLRKLAGLYPSAEEISDTLSLEQAEKLFVYQAKQMADLGFHLNLAPVAEVCTDTNKDFLDGRSYGSFEKVLNYGKLNVKKFENYGIGTVLKHFPGNSNTDPHSGLPEINLSEKDLFESLKSFEELIKENPSGILMSHARTTAVDKETPACLSSVWVTDILRKKYGYNGIIFSDDIFMGALSKNNYPPEKAVLMAVNAGIDSIMISEKRFASMAKILYNKAIEDNEFVEKINAAVRRIIEFKIKKHILQFDINEDENLNGWKLQPVNPDTSHKRTEDFYEYRKLNNNLFQE